MANSTSSVLTPDLAEAWEQLTPQHQLLVLTLVQTLAAEDTAIRRADSGGPVSVADVDEVNMALALARLAALPPPAQDAWRQTVGMFGNDPILREITDEAARLRAAERNG
jgi:hypothetical protein